MSFRFYQIWVEFQVKFMKERDFLISQPINDECFFTVYTIVSLWEHLLAVDKKILTHFVRICLILVSRIVKSDLVLEAHQRLIKIAKLIEENHGHNKITLNIHLSLHLYDYLIDYGLLYAFWYFSF